MTEVKNLVGILWRIGIQAETGIREQNASCSQSGFDGLVQAAEGNRTPGWQGIHIQTASEQGAQIRGHVNHHVGQGKNVGIDRNASQWVRRSRGDRKRSRKVEKRGDKRTDGRPGRLMRGCKVVSLKDKQRKERNQGRSTMP